MTRKAKASGVPEEPPVWLTGTTDDQFIPIYLAMSMDLTMIGQHGPVSPSELDRMDLSLVAAFLGVGVKESRQERVNRQFMDAHAGADPEVVMVKKSRA